MNPDSTPSRHHLSAAGLASGLTAERVISWAPVAEGEAGGERPTLLHFIHGIGGGGAEAMLRGLVRALDRRRWRVVVVAMQAEAWPEEAEEIRRSTDAFHVLGETSFLARSTLSKLRRVIQNERPAIVQTWMHHADFVGGLMARLAGVRQVVWSLHCREITRAPGESAWKALAFKQCLPLASRWVPRRIVSCSQVALEDHVRMGYPREKIVWIANGIDTQRFRPLESARVEMRARLGIAEDAPVIGFAGRFHEMKNLPLLLRAFSVLLGRLPQARLILCGVRRADLDAECQALLGAMAQPGAVLTLPFQSAPESFYPALDVFSLSSRTEACPMTVMEAMACGVPCVTTNVGDCGLLIGETGGVVPAGDVDGLSAAWAGLLLKTPEERARLGSQARRRAVETFAIERAAEGYMRLYETLVPVIRS